MTQQSLFMSDYLNTLSGPKRKAKGKAKGIAKVSANNEAFLEACRSKAHEICLENGFVNPDDIREWAQSHGIHPQTSKNAWGAIWKSHEWQRCGKVQSRIPTNNGREINLWRIRTNRVEEYHSNSLESEYRDMVISEFNDGK